MKYLNQYTLRPKDLLVYALLIFIIEAILYTIFKVPPVNAWVGFLVVGLVEGFSPSRIHSLRDENRLEED